MKATWWVVKLVKQPGVFCWKSDYFPRQFALKKDALECKKSVEANGGIATVEKVEKRRIN